MECIGTGLAYTKGLIPSFGLALLSLAWYAWQNFFSSSSFFFFLLECEEWHLLYLFENLIRLLEL